MRTERYLKIISSSARGCAFLLALLVLAAHAAALCGATASDADTSSAEPPTLNDIDAAYLYNPESGTLVYSKNADRLVYPASSVKLMSAYTALGCLSSRLSEKLTITSELIADTVGTRYGLTAGDTVTIRDLFYIAFAGCYNDGVLALARLAADDISSFVELMNENAAALGMTDTYYTNVTGMHDRLMRTTAADVGKLALALSESEFYMTVTSSPTYTLEGSEKKYTVNNRNELISQVSGKKYYNSLCRGMNVGMTEDAGYSLTTLARQENTGYICVIMGGRETEDGRNSAYDSANALIKWAFENYGYREIVSSSTVIAELPVTFGEDTDAVLLVPAEAYYCYLPTSAVIGDDITFTVTLNVDSLEAPFTAGVRCGAVTIRYDGDILTSIPLVTKTAATQNKLLYQMEQIRKFSKSRFFIATVISALVLTVLYNAWHAFLSARKGRKHNKYR